VTATADSRRRERSAPDRVRRERRTRFFELRTRHAVLVIPNPWDVGSAKLLAGADRVDVPGLNTTEQIRTVVDALGIPVDVLALPGGPCVEEIGEAGARRVSTGGDAMVSGTTPHVSCGGL